MMLTIMIAALLQRASSHAFKSTAFVTRQQYSNRLVSSPLLNRNEFQPKNKNYANVVSFSEIISRHASTTSSSGSSGTNESITSVVEEDQNNVSSNSEVTKKDVETGSIDPIKSPWSPENVPDNKKSSSRFRQHVNPLARKFQMPTDMISEEWPNDGTFTDPTLPLHIDVGCGKGGFLLNLAKQRQEEEEGSKDGEQTNEKRNYLGLEIRPSVAQYAKGRITKRNLDGVIDFVGCNANVDLDRLLSRYTCNGGGEIALLSIQYPDPHFKKSHQKRRVVTPELVDVLAKYILPGREIFIQSDIKDVLDAMRLTIREDGAKYFTDVIQDVDEYMDINPIGVPTEREVSVLDQNLPVYRTVFRRTDVKKE